MRLLLLFLGMFSMQLIAQDDALLAKAYLLKSETSFTAKDTTNTISYLDKAIAISKEITDPSFYANATQIYNSVGKFKKAKTQAAKYFSLAKDKKSESYAKMLLLYVDINEELQKQKDTAVTKTKKKVLESAPSTSKDTIKTIKKTENYLEKVTALITKKEYQKADSILKNYFGSSPDKSLPLYKKMLYKKVAVIEALKNPKPVQNKLKDTTKTQSDKREKRKEVKKVKKENSVQVPIAIIEEFPVYPGCTGSKKEKRACLDRSIKKHVTANFNSEIADSLNLGDGKCIRYLNNRTGNKVCVEREPVICRIFVMFKIAKDGTVQNVKTKAPHPLLKKEAERVVKLLPVMTPGKQRGKAVGVKYTIPIVFSVQ